MIFDGFKIVSSSDEELEDVEGWESNQSLCRTLPMEISRGPFNNYVDKMRGEGEK